MALTREAEVQHLAAGRVIVRDEEGCLCGGEDYEGFQAG
jgi:hypothetical protein